MFKKAAERAKVLQAVGEADPNEFIDLVQFANQVEYSKVELVDLAGHNTSARRSQRCSTPITSLQIQETIKSELLDTTAMVPAEERGQLPIKAPVEAPIRASVKTHMQPLIGKDIRVTSVASTIDDQTESNLQPQGKVPAERVAAANVEHVKYKQHTPPRKKFKSEKCHPRITASLASQAFSIDAGFAEEHRLKLEEDERDLDKEIREAEHLAELRRKKAALKAKLEAVNTQHQRSTSSFSSPSGSNA